MKIRLKGTIKGREGSKSITWPAGKDFDDTEEKIPADILIALENKNPKVEVVYEVDNPSTHSVSDEKIKATVEDLEEAREEVRKLKDEAREKDKALEDAIARIGELEKQNQELLAQEEAKGNDFPCPVEGCEKSFASERALNTHITKAHPDYERQ